MTKTQNSLLNTPLRSPVGFQGAPHNPIPPQEIPPLATPRMSMGSQRMALQPTPLQQTPLQAVPTFAFGKQSLYRVAPQKHQVLLPPMETAQYAQNSSSIASRMQGAEAHRSSLQPLSLQGSAARGSHQDYTSASIPYGLPGRPLSLRALPISASNLKPLKSFRATGTSRSAGLAERARRQKRAQASCPPLVVGMPEAFGQGSSSGSTESLQFSCASESLGLPLLSERRLPLQGQQISFHPIYAAQQPVARRLSCVKHGKRDFD